MLKPNHLIEVIAAVQRQIWANWMQYLFSRCTIENDGGLTIPAEYVERWTRQIKTPYMELPEEEKESDRAQAKKILSSLGKANTQPAQSQSAIATAATPGYRGISGNSHGKRSA